MKKLTTQEFIKKAEEIRPEYDFSKVIYNNSHEKVEIICPTHGLFYIRPCDLINGYGCPYCGGTKRMNTEEFIKKATEVHNGYFSYEKTEYINSNTKVIVTCPVHGDFEVKANNHLNGVNCKKCTKENITHEIRPLKQVNQSTKKLTTESFIKKAKEKYGDRYSYENTNYKKNNVKVSITCREHGDFLVTPNHFLSGRGCPKCGKNYSYSNDEFITKLKEKYGDKYLYDKVCYISTHKPILIGCKKHGYFNISPANLLKGEGCPVCSESKLEKNVENFLIKNEIAYISQYKPDFLKKQSIDFFIPIRNIGIECQGIQHFQPVDIFGGEEGFETQKGRDKEKEKLCNLNGIRLLYYADYKYNFPYNVITSMEELLDTIKK